MDTSRCFFACVLIALLAVPAAAQDDRTLDENQSPSDTAGAKPHLAPGIAVADDSDGSQG